MRGGLLFVIALGALAGCSSSSEPAATASAPPAETAGASKPIDHMPADAKAAMDAGRAASGQ